MLKLIEGFLFFFTSALVTVHGVVVVRDADRLVVRDEVALEWRHDYVTTEFEGGCSSSSPQRPITHLAKL